MLVIGFSGFFLDPRERSMYHTLDLDPLMPGGNKKVAHT